MSDTKCVVGGGKFLPPGSPYIDQIKQKFRCPNPKYSQAMALRQNGKYVQVPDTHVYACQMIPIRHAWGMGLMVPRGIKLGEDWAGLQFIPRKSFPKLRDQDAPLVFADGVALRPYQTEAVDQLVRQKEGLVIAPCGAGKTMIGLGAMIQFATRTVVLVHTHDLAKQWKDRIEAQLQTINGDVPTVTICGGGKRDDSGQIVIAMFQSLAKGRWEELHEWSTQFGMCIVDEAHHVPANTFSQVMMSMPAKIRLGLTATPDRPDGLSAILYWHFGKELYRITTQELIDAGRVLAPRIQFTRTRWSTPGKMDWPKLITRMCKDEERNEQILSMVLDFVSDGRQVLVLSDRVQHCIDMAELVADNGWSAAALVGKMSKKQRAEVLEAANNREVKAIFATTVADEGLDLPGLDTVILTTPTKAMGRIQQRIGRIMRTAENKKEPIVVDLVDNSKPLYYLHKKRAKFYRSLGCTVQEL
tara:strand:- start:10430 stop:11845 length:1416 start_codon:yes stop_codon:yes gene_type:complete